MDDAETIIVEHQGEVFKLTADQVNDIKRHYELAADTGGAVGNHWVLLAVIQRCGIPIRSTVDAMEIGANLWMNYYPERLWHLVHKAIRVSASSSADCTITSMATAFDPNAISDHHNHFSSSTIASVFLAFGSISTDFPWLNFD